ncbi:hypothetical protein VC83_04870 [Pseudogymnoascus destructans]|uniref:Uncharacterized protein n=1 Tax=Pseudogymnoascus destructans TaxID=655981 RepID=A0A177A9N2_9PEZI|nr:uncharacterized protein VC83_04870 [Pseudogymnoascus destructans]OAF58460.1 hypothetical protein VC83_04870 [Pseudogymnoascus destructans]
MCAKVPWRESSSRSIGVFAQFFFEEAEETRWLTGNGEEIMIYDPANVADTTKRYTTADALEIPKGFVVEVIWAWVKMEKTK